MRATDVCVCVFLKILTAYQGSGPTAVADLKLLLLAQLYASVLST